MAFDPAHSAIYAISYDGNKLYSINGTTGAATLTNDSWNDYFHHEGLQFDAGGVRWVLWHSGSGWWDIVTLPSGDVGMDSAGIFGPYMTTRSLLIDPRLEFASSPAPTPTISGTVAVGQTLTASPGALSPVADSVTYQWNRDAAVVSDATSSTYDVNVADIGHAFSVTVTAVKAGYRPKTETSVDTAVVPPQAFVTSPTPTISGTTTVGETLTAATESWSPAPDSLGYVWKRGGTAIEGATSATYVLQPADAGQVVTVTVTASKAGYAPRAMTSAATDSIALVAFVQTFQPLITNNISHNGRPGLTVSAWRGSAEDWSPVADRYSVQWMRDETAISGQTGVFYTLQSADYGHSLWVSVTASTTGYAPATRASERYLISLLGAFAEAPVPTISGVTAVGSRLTAAPGTWSPAADSYAYQWNRGGVALEGATASTYDLQVADAESVITVTVTATTVGYSPTAQTSAETAAITGLAFDATSTPTLTGVALVGETLTAHHGAWSPTPDTFTYAWKRGGNPIPRATESTYVLQPSDAGQTMTVTVTATAVGFTSTGQTSGASEMIATAPFATAPVPTISGSLIVGQRLSGSVGAWSPVPSFTYRWWRDGVLIPGVTGARYTLTATDVGARITFDATGSTLGYTPTMISSVETDAVVRAAFSATSIPTISGTAAVGQRLTVLAGTYSPAAAFSYVWKRDGVPISGGVGAGYTAAAADLEAIITVTVTASRNGYVSDVQTTAETDAVVRGTFVIPPVPTISGTPAVGQRLTAVTGAYSAPAAFSYVWKRNGVAVPGAVGATYGIVFGDIDAKVTVEVTASRNGYVSDVQTTAETDAVVRGTFISPPVPTISGTPAVGQRLTAVTGAYSAPAAFSYVWKRNGVAVPGAVGATYGIVFGDIDAKVTVEVTASRNGFTPVVQTTAETDAVARVPFTIAPTPTISGTATVGQRLTVSSGLWSPLSGVTYVWKRGGNVIAGATSSSYLLGVADADAKITVEATGARAGYLTTTKTSAETTAVTRLPFVATSVPTISGSAVVGQRLTVFTGTYSPAAAFTYVWKRDGTVISGGVGAGYTAAAADVSAKITVEVTAYRNGYTAVVQTTAETEAVARGTFISPPVPTISGSAVVGQRLTVVTGSYSVPAAFTYRWKRNTVAIPGAIGAGFTPGTADVGKTLTVEVTAYRHGFTQVVQTTEETITVTR
jgi:hypothetical protein